MAAMRRRDADWYVGVGGLLAGLVGAAVLAVDGQGHLGGAFAPGPKTIYGPGQAGLAVAVGVAGAMMLLIRGRTAAAAVTGLIGLAAAQLAGLGLVAVRRWPLYWGCCSPVSIKENLVRDLAALMALVCGAVAVTSFVVLLRRQDLHWDRRGVIVAAPVAVLIAVAAPLMASSLWSGDLPAVTGWAVAYSIPCAAGIVICARMSPSGACVVLMGIVVSAVIATAGDSFLELRLEWGAARVLVILGAGVVGASRFIAPGRQASASEKAS